MKLKQIQLAIVAASLAWAMNASAIFVHVTGVSPGQVVNLTVTGSITYGGGGVWAGIYNLAVGGPPGVATPSFCIDVYRNSGDSYNYYYQALDNSPLGPAGPMGAAAASTVEKLWANYFTGAQADGTGFEAASLQVAIWQVVAQGQNVQTVSTLDDYFVSVSQATVMNRAAQMIANPGSVEADLVGILDSSRQNYVVPNPVPEPTTVIAGALLLLPFGMSTLRMLRKKA
jgi:hypothetical protein